MLRDDDVEKSENKKPRIELAEESLNRKLIIHLEKYLLEYEENYSSYSSTANKFRFINTSKAIDAIKAHPYEIKNIHEVKNIAGVGKGTCAKIQEFLDMTPPRRI